MSDRPAIDPATGWDLDRPLGRGVPTMRPVRAIALVLGPLLWVGPRGVEWLAMAFLATVAAASVLVLGLQARALARAHFEGAESSRQLRRELAWLYVPFGVLSVLGCLLLALDPGGRSNLDAVPRIVLGTLGGAAVLALTVGTRLCIKYRR